MMELNMPFQSYIYIGELKIPMSGYYFVVMRIICSTAIIQEVIYGMKRRIMKVMPQSWH